MSDIDIAVVDSLKALDPERPIREADIGALRIRAHRRRRTFEVKKATNRGGSPNEPFLQHPIEISPYPPIRGARFATLAGEVAVRFETRLQAQPRGTMRISKIIFSVAAATTAFLGISAASAADMPAYSKAPVLAPVPVYNWTGFYVGGNVGYSWDNTAAAFSGNSLTSIFFAANIFPTAIGLNTNGVLAGGQFGYNWQVSPMWVVGFETDLQWQISRGLPASCRPQSLAPICSRPPSPSRWIGSARLAAGSDSCPLRMCSSTARAVSPMARGS